MKRFYHPDTLEINQNIYLDDSTAHHALQVIRVKIKERFIIFNGDGFDYTGKVINIKKPRINIHHGQHQSCKEASELKVLH